MTGSSTSSAAQDLNSGRAVVILCFVVALLEGIDIQSMGLAAPLLGKEFGLNPSQIGLALSASLLGLLAGAVLGGSLSDRIGRKSVLIASVCLLGMFSLATTIVPTFSALLVVRFLTGVGMGGAFPTLIAITSESVAPRIRATAISLMYCGMPLGGALAAAVANGTSAFGWRPVFYLGGAGPLAVAVLLAFALPSSTNSRTRTTHITTNPNAHSFAEALFGDNRASPTRLLWTSYFFTLLIVYLLLNWLPSLMIANGFAKSQATTVSMVMNFGAAVGSVSLGMLMDRSRKQVVVAATYMGTVISLVGLAFLHPFELVLIAAFGAGFCGIGGQLILYALSPNYYPPAVRGTGIGSAVAVGRFGAITGPLVAGQILTAGGGASVVLLAAVPCLVIASAAALYLLSKPTLST